MIITISGNPGAGKSTVAKILASELNAERILVGAMRRDLARSMGMNLEELNEYGKTHPETDTKVDKEVKEKVKKLVKENKNIVLEGYAQHKFFPEAFKVFMEANKEICCQRIWHDLQNGEAKTYRNEGKYENIEEFKKRYKIRLNEDAERFMKFYGFDHRDKSQYDLVLDVTHISAKEATKKIISSIKKPF